jgi:hypothetical protein
VSASAAPSTDMCSSFKPSSMLSLYEQWDYLQLGVQFGTFLLRLLGGYVEFVERQPDERAVDEQLVEKFYALT